MHHPFIAAITGPSGSGKSTVADRCGIGDGTINAIRASFNGENMGIADTPHNAHYFVAKFVYDDGVVSFDEVIV